MWEVNGEKFIAVVQWSFIIKAKKRSRWQEQSPCHRATRPPLRMEILITPFMGALNYPSDIMTRPVKGNNLG